jgi:hypothetical protein
LNRGIFVLKLLVVAVKRGEKLEPFVVEGSPDLLAHSCLFDQVRPLAP